MVDGCYLEVSGVCSWRLFLAGRFQRLTGLASSVVITGTNTHNGLRTGICSTSPLGETGRAAFGLSVLIPPRKAPSMILGRFTTFTLHAARLRTWGQHE